MSSGEARDFDKYMKTVLWTKKNNKGAKVTKKSNISLKDTKNYRQRRHHPSRSLTLPQH